MLTVSNGHRDPTAQHTSSTLSSLSMLDSFPMSLACVLYSMSCCERLEASEPLAGLRNKCMSVSSCGRIRASVSVVSECVVSECVVSE